MKRFFAILPAVALLSVGLVACSQDTPDPAEPKPLGDCLDVNTGDLASALTGDFGEEVQLSQQIPVAPLETVELVSGGGTPVIETDGVIVSHTMINASSCSLVYHYKEPMWPNLGYISPIKNVLEGASVGDRVALNMPIDDFASEAGIDSVPGFEKGDALLILFDIVSPILSQAEGEAVALPAGTPEVTVAANGEPTIKIPEGAQAPTKLSVYPMIKGDGAVIEETNEVLVHYRGVIWRTGEEFDSSWSRGNPAQFAASGVIGGFKQALVGQTVGSRMLSIVPAEDGGYGPDQLKAMGHQGDDVMVFVLDILAAW